MCFFCCIKQAAHVASFDKNKSTSKKTWVFGCNLLVLVQVEDGQNLSVVRNQCLSNEVPTEDQLLQQL